MVALSELVDAFLKSRSAGISDAQIREEARGAGWSTADIDSAFSIIASKVPHASGGAIASIPLTPVASTSSSKTLLFVGLAVVVALLIAGATAYAYLEKLGPFAHAPYEEGNLLSGLLAKASEIDSSSYKLAVAMYVAPRDADAEPFAVVMKESIALKEKYLRDSERAQSIGKILSTLSGKTRFPSSIVGIKPSYTQYFDTTPIDTTDPLTNVAYAYKTTNAGSNFALEVTFETDDAIAMIRENNTYAATPTVVEGKKVTFTKESSSYLYFPSEPPKSFLEELSEYAMYLPPEMNIKGSVSMAAGKNKLNADSFDWKFGLDGSGDFGDLSYKVSVEALKYASDYYVRINNMPSLFFGFLPPKGQWVKFTPQTGSSTEEDVYTNPFVSADELAEAEKEYKEKKGALVALLKKTAEFADEERVFLFKNPPQKEKVDGRSLYRYDLKMRKEAVLPFYKKFAAEAAKEEYLAQDFAEVDTGYLNYLESSEFSETFDYYDKNIFVTLWTDQKGFPALVKYAIRIVPADEAATFKDKQIMLEFTLSLDDINKPLEINVPEGAKSYEEVMKENGDPFGKSRSGGETVSLKSNLSSVRAAAELAYDTNGASYGNKAFPLGSCSQTEDTLFGDAMVYESLAKATDNGANESICISKIGPSGMVDNYAVAVAMPDKTDYYYCVDSTGSAKEVVGPLTDSVCE